MVDECGKFKNEDVSRSERVENKNIVVFGIYKTLSALESAVAEFKDAGFRNADISALLPRSESTKEFAHEKGTKAPEGATTGAVAGAALGGTLGWLAGIGSLAIPGLGPLIAAGPIMAALSGAAAGGTIGGISGALIGMGMPEYEAKRYEGRVKEGGHLLSVHCDDNSWKDRALAILKRSGAEDIAATTEADSDSDERIEHDKPRRMVGNY